MTKKSKKERRISVRAPDYIPKKEPIFKDTTGTEALDIFKLIATLGKIFSIITIAGGIFAISYIMYNIIMSTNIFLDSLFITILGFIGGINIVCGLFLLAKK
ncbi:MAG: hypothetical protein P8Y18_07685 [Candidatus Bathyarchaeota archaeon]